MDLRPDFYGVDLLPTENVSIIADLNEPLDLFPDNSVSHIYTRHCLEHIDCLLPLMKELHRLLIPNGELEIIVPHFSNPYHYSDPTHVRTFGLYTMYYFVDQELQPPRKVPSFYSDVRFEITGIMLRLLDRKWCDRLMFPFLQRLVNRSIGWQDRFERRLCRLFPAAEIRYIMRAMK